MDYSGGIAGDGPCHGVNWHCVAAALKAGEEFWESEFRPVVSKYLAGLHSLSETHMRDSKADMSRPNATKL